MFKQIFCLFIILSIVLSLGACTSPSNETSENESSNANLSSSVTSNSNDDNTSDIESYDDISHESSSVDNTISDSDDTAIISITEVPYDDFDNYDTDVYVDKAVAISNYYALISVDVSVTDFKFFSIDEEYFMDSSEALTSPLVIEEVLYTLPELTPDNDLIIKTYINDAVANRGISFVDSDGETHYFSINCNVAGFPDLGSIYLLKMNIGE